MKILNFCNLSTAEKFAVSEWAQANIRQFREIDRTKPVIDSVHYSSDEALYDFEYITTEENQRQFIPARNQMKEIQDIHTLYSLALRDLNDTELAVYRIFRRYMAHDWAVDGYINHEVISIISDELDLEIDQVKGYYGQLVQKGFCVRRSMPVNGEQFYMTEFPEDPEAQRRKIADK